MVHTAVYFNYLASHVADFMHYFFFFFVKYKPGTYYTHYVTNDLTIRKISSFMVCVCVCVCGVCVRHACTWEAVVLTVTCF